MKPDVEEPVDAPPARRASSRSWRTKLLGDHPLGIIFATPYAVFLVAVFAYPLGLRRLDELPRLLLRGSGSSGRPSVRRLRQLRGGVVGSRCPTLVLQRGDLLGDQRAADRRHGRWCSPRHSNAVSAGACVPEDCLLHPLRHGERGAGGRLAVPFRQRRLGERPPGPAGARPLVVHQQQIGDADRSPCSSPGNRWACSSCSTSLPCRTCPKSCTSRPRWTEPGSFGSFMNVTVPSVRPATTLALILATITGANLFTEPYLLTSGGGPDGASTSPVFVDVPAGHRAGHPGCRRGHRRDPGDRRARHLSHLPPATWRTEYDTSRIRLRRE